MTEERDLEVKSRFIREDEAAALMGMKPKEIRDLMDRDGVPYFDRTEKGRGWQVDREAFEYWISETLPRRTRDKRQAEARAVQVAEERLRPSVRESMERRGA